MRSFRKKITLIILGISIFVILSIGLLVISYYYWGIETLFNERISLSISKTNKIAELYLEEHTENIKISVLKIAEVIRPDFEKMLQYYNFEKTVSTLDRIVEDYHLSSIAIIHKNRILLQNTFNIFSAFQNVQSDAFSIANRGDIFIKRNGNIVECLIRLNTEISIDPYYIWIRKYIDEEVSEYLISSRDSASLYRQLLSNLSEIRQNVIYVILSIMVILIIFSIIISMKIINMVTEPLVSLTNIVSNINANNGQKFAYQTFNHIISNDEIGILSQAFKNTFDEIFKKNQELVNAHKIIEKRQKFIETILSEVSVGIIVLDMNYDVTLINKIAVSILGLEEEINNNHLLHKNCADIFPEVLDLIYKNISNGFNNKDYHSYELQIKQKLSLKRNLFVKICILNDENNDLDSSIIITFSDITEIAIANQIKTWNDLAIKVAHEIKNPLTPIKLSVERISYLVAKYRNEDLPVDQIKKYTIIVSEKVEAIKKMLSEFLNFSRMSKPNMNKYNLSEIVQEVILLEKNVYSNINYVVTESFKDRVITCDKEQLKQVIENLLKNSAESIMIKKKNSGKGYIGEIKISIVEYNEYFELDISDNGVGIEEDMIDNIFKPYITSKKEGFGVGLSIVKKILANHEWDLSVNNITDDNGNKCGVKFSIILYKKV